MKTAFSAGGGEELLHVLYENLIIISTEDHKRQVWNAIIYLSINQSVFNW